MLNKIEKIDGRIGLYINDVYLNELDKRGESLDISSLYLYEL